MVSRLFWAGVFVCLTAGCVWAQDPIKVESRHYKLDFENDHVQVVSVHYGPHEKSALHDHPGGVVVSVTEGHLCFTDESGKTREVHAKPGEVRWYPPFKHKVENLSDVSYDAVYVGMKGKLSAASTPASDQPPQTDEETRKLLQDYLLAARKP
jgi:quercetin dioxygenase-like cupin family protein